MTLDAALIERFASIVRPGGALTAAYDIAPHLKEWRGTYRGASPLVLKPETTAQVSAILALAQETRTPVVPQGGNTGLVGGGIPDESGTALILSLSRMNAIRALDAAGNTVIVEAGCTLQAVQDAAEAADRLFPLALASAGSCQIGGNLSTNAGGIGALSFGVARDLCLGLEVVLPDGAVVNGLRTLKKDNRGYDLKNLFIGAEGTLGVITAASLKLFAQPKGRALGWIAVATPDAALQLLHLLQQRQGPALTAFELCAARAMEFALRHGPVKRAPLAGASPWFVLVEISSGISAAAATAALEAALEDALAEGLIDDAALSASLTQERDFIAIREAVSDSQKAEGVSLKHDVSVPVAAIPAFIAEAMPLVEAVAPGARPVCFGHMGDGNLHFNISQPEGWPGEAFAARREAMADAIHGLVARFGGSFSAEHGIGQMKRDLLARTHDPVSLALMRTLKAALDPAGIMNPGKVL